MINELDINDLIVQAKLLSDAYLVLLDLSEETGIRFIKGRKLKFSYQGKSYNGMLRSVSGAVSSRCGSYSYRNSGSRSYGYIRSASYDLCYSIANCPPSYW